MAAHIKRSELLRLYVEGNLSKLVWHFLKRVPTSSELLNLYIYALTGIAGLVFGLFKLLRFAEESEARAEIEAEKAALKLQESRRALEEESAAFRERWLTM